MPDNSAVATHRQLTRALLDPDCYPHTVTTVERLETHISTVLLAGDYAYKLKKPLNLGFLDFTTTERRRACCLEELRLNRRLAPDIYLGMSVITGTPEAPGIDGAGGRLDYAVRMRRFPQDQRLDQILERGTLRPHHLDSLADDIAAFHRSEDTAGTPPPPANSVQGLLQPVLDNLDGLDRLLKEPAARACLDRLDAWTRDRTEALRPLTAQRLRQGFIRECHGDLHLENIVLLEDRPVPFDGIEFSEALRWIDVVNELAFLCMDLVHRERPDAAARITSRYLDATGDHAGVPLLRYYQVYRALVRAKIHALRLDQGDLAAAEQARTTRLRDDYLALAERLTTPPAPTLTVTCGLSGSGKSTAALALVEYSGAIRLRSDVERKRLQGLEASARTGSAVGGGLYGAAATRATYERLGRLAESLLEAGWPVVVDAACLRREQRALFQGIAAHRQVPFRLLYCEAPVEVLRERIQRRTDAGQDPSEANTAVLDHQLTQFQPPGADERLFLVKPPL